MAARPAERAHIDEDSAREPQAGRGAGARGTASAAPAGARAAARAAGTRDRKGWARGRQGLRDHGRRRQPRASILISNGEGRRGRGEITAEGTRVKGKGRAGKGEEGKKEGLRQFPANIVRGPSWARGGGRSLAVGGVLEGRGRSGWPGAQRAGGWLPERSAELLTLLPAAPALGRSKNAPRSRADLSRPGVVSPSCARSCTEMFITDLAGRAGDSGAGPALACTRCSVIVDE